MLGSQLNLISPLPGITFKCVIATACESTFALDSEGYAWAIGLNLLGQLGDGTNTTRDCWVRVCCNYQYCKLASTGVHALGLKTDGTLVAWGSGTCGGLGDGTTTGQCQPVAVCCNYCYCDIANVSGSLYEAAVVGIKTDGTAVSWGSGSGGKLGSGAITPRCVPGAVCCDYCYKKISSSISTTAMSFIGIKCDDTAVSWGCGTCGQLGDGTIAAKCQPVAVCCNYCYDHISGGKCYYVGLTTDGIAVSWGDNSNYKLGNRIITDRCQPGLMCKLIE